mmetsp:Transcript_40166/g.61334  ORF Transcript_40166/g.61334 Transcript_40166/m.61334 type:complete len:93 (+) Transcript_40166:445-723(+)|eukprot:CAMPEP_0170490308 /NCGR_PEP_ID=MMETSP0208-20121228/8520_1 /TAXON_ID=197538 /ORGANISM="Strombidium inclinatum, Strain S3" /LENGTH=92 /DNA_ID=CAMNT_0010765623 /DNA_START=430 /DNA_END=708 /DNA_ORIENTATION=+
MSSKQFLKLVQSFDEEEEEEEDKKENKECKRGPKSAKAPSHKARSEFRKKKYKGAKSEKSRGKLKKKQPNGLIDKNKKQEPSVLSSDLSTVK